ncbi:hypothetical protein HK097_010737, partial [Rhizophlyctis rosea]
VTKAVAPTSRRNSNTPAPAPWMPVLVDSYQSNAAFPGSNRAHIATIGPNGRPQNHSLQFKQFGINTAVPQSELKLPPLSPAAGPTTTIVKAIPETATSSSIQSKLNALLVFAADVRTLSLTQNHHFLPSLSPNRSTLPIVGRTFTLHPETHSEVSWTFPITADSFRLSGRLYLSKHAESETMSFPSILPAWSPKDKDPSASVFERARQRMWENMTRAEKGVYGGSIENLGLLMLDVEEVEHVVSGPVGEVMVRTGYKCVVPKRSYGRGAGVCWEVKGMPM